MKGKIPRIVMVVVALAMAMSLVAGVTTVSTAHDASDKPGVDETWTGFTLPSEVNYQTFPGTEVSPLELADDGTLFAAVNDETNRRWGSPRGQVGWAVFCSTDGGYNWSFSWELPEIDPGPIVDIVVAPDYEHPGSVYVATFNNLYESTNGGDSFYRTPTVCPGVAGNPDDGIWGGRITSLDVAIDAEEPDEYVAMVGTDMGDLDGVYTWNLHGEDEWRDMEIGNVPAANWDTGNGDGTDEGVLEVRFSINYPTDRIIYAVANYDPCIIDPPWIGPTGFTTVVTVRDGAAGTWGVEHMDAAIWGAPGDIPQPCVYARLDFFDDFDIDGSPYCVVAVSGLPGVTVVNDMDDVYRVKSLPPATGPSTIEGTGINTPGQVPVGTNPITPLYDVEAYGAYLLGGTILVPVIFPVCPAGVFNVAATSGQAQVLVGTSPFIFTNWEPAMKPPSGGAGFGLWFGGIDVESDGRYHYVATGENWGATASGVSVGRQNMAGKFIWNGVGLIDTIVVTTDVLGWTNYAAVTFEETSPHWAVGSEGDDTLYITTWSKGFCDVFGMGDWSHPNGNMSGEWSMAIDHDGDISGRLWGQYLNDTADPNLWAPIYGTFTGSVSTPFTCGDSPHAISNGCGKICVGDPVGTCCIFEWGGNIKIPPCSGAGPLTPEMQNVHFDFEISQTGNPFAPLELCRGKCDVVSPVNPCEDSSAKWCCDPETNVDVTGCLYKHAYGIDVWRNAPTGLEQSPEQAIVWERIGCENMVLPLPPILYAYMGQTVALFLTFVGLPITDTEGCRPSVSDEWFDMSDMHDSWGWQETGLSELVGINSICVPKVGPGFEFDSDMDADEFVFMLGGVGGWIPFTTGPGIAQYLRDQLWYSFDGGESMYYTSTMPQGAVNIQMPGGGGPGMADVAWDVADDNTIIMSDVTGWIYKTTNKGNSWTDGVETATGLPTDLNVSPIYSEEGGEGTDLSVLVGLYNTASTAGQVWLSQDGAEEQFVQVGRDIVDDNYSMLSKIVTNFDQGWGTESSPTNRFIYAGANGFLARYCCGCPRPCSVDEVGDVGVYRTVVNVGNPSDSIWEQIYDYWDFVNDTPGLPDPVDCAWQYLFFTDLDYQEMIGDAGEDATVYIPFGIVQYTGVVASQDLGYMPKTMPSGANYPFRMNFALGGMLRTLDGTKERVEWIGWNDLTLGMPRSPYCGLWQVSAVEGTNYLFSIAFQLDVIDFDWDYDPDVDLADYDIGLVIYEDSLCEDPPDLISPSDDATNVGEIKGSLDEVNVILEWDKVLSTALVTYEVQLDEDSKFNASEVFVPAATADEAAAVGLVRQATTTEDFTAFADLENGFTYFWRVRVVDPALSPWSDVYTFTTTITGELGAPVLESPESGAEYVALRPTFEWSAVAWADTYDLEVATDSAFSSTVIDEALSAQAYQPASDLDENTTYYWRVKASSDTQDSSWSATGIFTTGPPPAEAGAGTPAWVWVVIVIGAILAIAVIVLIVRTRRPV